jgi:hypothetical protein
MASWVMPRGRVDGACRSRRSVMMDFDIFSLVTTGLSLTANSAEGLESWPTEVDAVGFYARAACCSVEIRENQKSISSKTSGITHYPGTTLSSLASALSSTTGQTPGCI